MHAYLISTIVLVSIFTANNALATMRIWTSSTGKVIEAEYIGHMGDKIELRKTNGKTIEVPLTYLSKDDQFHASKLAQPKSQPVFSISKSKIISLVTEYEKFAKENSAQAGDLYSYSCSSTAETKKINAALNLLYNKTTDDLEKSRRPIRTIYPDITDISIQKIDGLDVLITIEMNKTHSTDGYINLSENGKIKYDSIFFLHPAESAITYLDKLCYFYDGSRRQQEERQENSFRMIFDYFDALNKTGIPTFGLNKEQSLSEQKDSLKKCFDWLFEDASSWDSVDPKTPLNKRKYKKLLEDSRLKSRSKCF